MAALAGQNDIDLLLFDLGGTIYDDSTYTRALLRAVHDIDPSVHEHEFWAVYDAKRMRASGSLRTAIANHFVPNQDRERLTTLARGYWEYPASAVYPDVKPALKALAAQFKLGLVANSGEAALKALRRDGLRDLFTVIAPADFVGVEKPDERIFRYALKTAGVSPSRAVHVGNRLESDIRPAQRLGMRTVWLLRGDAPDVIPFTGHSQRRALLVIRFAVLDLGSCSKDVNWSRRDRLRKTVGSSRASCE